MSNQEATRQWWYEQGGQPKGPLGSDEICSMVESGVLVRSSRIILVGASEWGTIDQHASELGVRSPEPGTATSAPPGPGPGAPPPPQDLSRATVTYSAPAYTPAPGPGPGPTAPLTSSGKRFGVYLLDCLLAVVTLYIGWLIWSLVIYGKGQTPGKSLLGVRVVNADTGRVVTYGTMALRELVYKLLLGSVTFGITTLVGAIMILTDSERHQALWDKMANTVLVDDPEGRTL